MNKFFAVILCAVFSFPAAVFADELHGDCLKDGKYVAFYGGKYPVELPLPKGFESFSGMLNENISLTVSRIDHGYKVVTREDGSDRFERDVDDSALDVCKN